MMNEDPIYEEYVNICKTIVSPSRLKIIEAIGNRKMNVSEIQRHLNISMSNLSNHLNALQLTGVLGREKKGNFIYYFLMEPGLMEVLEKMKTIIYSISSRRVQRVPNPAIENENNPETN